ncbi:hypothetical protein OPIT5_10240 [Opitutaceae bacterium TAV5]|nr:hypothetical protein OPIT5_10240 [Opitutaceae bacterium TAV5]
MKIPGKLSSITLCMRPLKTVFLLSSLALIPFPAVSQTVITTVVEDHFSGRTSGTILGNTLPDTAGANQWISGSVFTDTESITIPSQGTSSGGRIIIAAPTEKIRVQADVIVGSAEWVGVGFQTGDNDFFVPTNPVMVYLRSNGTWYLCQNGPTEITHGTIADFSATASYTLGLEYDTIARTATVYINGAPVASVVALTLTNPAVGAAAFRINAQASTEVGASTVDNFIVQSITTAIPEPATAVVAMGGLIGLFIIMQKIRSRQLRE